MNKRIAGILVLLIACLPLCGASAAGITLKTASNFADTDSAAQSYVDVLTAWEEETGNTIEDFSSIEDETWNTRMAEAIAAGSYDVFCYRAGTPESAAILPYVVPISEIQAAYPDLAFAQRGLLAEADGNVYAIPVRASWWALYCNKDLFVANGLAAPTDWPKMEAAIAKFRELGITPISVSFADVPGTLAEFAILSSGTVAEHNARPTSPDQLPGSWARGMQLLNKLKQLGAFADDANATDDMNATDKFLSKEAAMRVDGSWLAEAMITEDQWDNVVVLPFPASDPSADPYATLGSMDMGFYLSRAAWNDATKRDAAVRLLERLTNPSAVVEFSFPYGGALLQSAQGLFDHVSAMSPMISDAMNYDARAQWFSQIPGMVDGSVDPAQVMQQVISQNAFEPEPMPEIPAEAQPAQ